jgi:tetratricopeptide (TPR) repeat protein
MMKYKSDSLGFSFELPEGWHRDEHNLTLTFFGPNGRIGSMSELIQMQFGTILPQYHSPSSREKFMAEPGAEIFRSKLGNETNVVVLKKPNDTEITAVHDGVHYTIAHSNDATTQNAVEKLKESFNFPSAEEAIEAIQRSSDPQKQAIMSALKAGSPEQARRELTEAGMPPVVDRPGYTMHHVGTRTQDNISRTNAKNLKISKAKTGMPVNNLDSIHKKAAKAGVLWRDKDYTEARILYQEIENSISLPLDRAKIMGNIAQLYAEEGNKTNALNTANAAIKIINDNELYKLLEGAHLRGYLNGFINRLQDKGTWEPLSYDKNIPIELNLNVFDRVRAHFSVAVISGVIFSILSSELSIPSIDISLFHKKIIVFSLTGFLFSGFFTSGMLQQSIVTIMAISKRDAKNSLKPAVNLLSVIAVLYLIVFSSAFWSMASEIVFFILTGVLGVGMFYGFMYRRHCRKIDE